MGVGSTIVHIEKDLPPLLPSQAFFRIRKGEVVTRDGLGQTPKVSVS